MTSRKFRTYIKVTGTGNGVNRTESRTIYGEIPGALTEEKHGAAGVGVGVGVG